MASTRAARISTTFRQQFGARPATLLLSVMTLIHPRFPGEPLNAAPFPGPELARVSTDLTGVSTWPGYRRPPLIKEMDVGPGRIAFAGHDLGALVMDRNTRLIRRFVSPTVGSDASDVALMGDFCLMADGRSNPEAHWFGVAESLLGKSGTMEEEIGFSVASLGELSITWTLASARDKTVLRTYSGGSGDGPSKLAEYVMPASVADVQPFELSGRTLALIQLQPTTGLGSLQVVQLDAGSPIQFGNLELPTATTQVRVFSGGRMLMVFAESGQARLRLYRLTLENNGSFVASASDVAVPDLNSLTLPFLTEELMVVQVRGPVFDSLDFYDAQDLSAPRKISTLAIPIPNRYGNRSYLIVQGDSVHFADYYGAYREADIADPRQPRWVSEHILTGSLESMAHNGNLLAVSEGIARALRLVDLTDAEQPKDQSVVATAGSLGRHRLAVSRHVIYALTRTGSTWLESVDFSEPTKPRIVRRKINLSGQGHALAADDERLIIAEDNELHLYSLRIPEHPVLVNRISGDFESAYLSLNDGFLYAINGTAFQVYDVRDLEGPKLLRTTAAQTDAWGNPIVDGRRLWVTGKDSFARLSKLWLFDITNPADPTPEAELAIRSARQDDEILPVGNHLLFATNHSSRLSSPWGNKFLSELKVFERSESGGKISTGRLAANVILREWEGDGFGRMISFRRPYTIGDLILLPTDRNGFDIVRASFLERPAPVIRHQPRALRVAAGRRAVLSATIDGALPLTFQWFRDGIAVIDSNRVSGAQSLCLAISTAAPEDAGTYALQVSNTTGSAVSTPVTVDVIVPRSLHLQLESAGDNTWRAVVSGDPGQVIRIEWSDNLLTWHEEETRGITPDVPLSEDPVSVDLKQRPGNQRYYRARTVFPN